MSNLTKFGEATGEQMTLFSRVASPDPASHTAVQENDLERKMTATSGRRCLEQFERFNRAGLWAKTFAALLIGMEGWSSTKCRLIWKMRATRSHRIYFQLVPSTLPIGGIEFGLLHTPRKIHATMEHEMQDHTHERFRANDLMNLTMLPTPRKESFPNSKTRIDIGAIDSLTTMAEMGLLPTPTPTATSDKKGGCTRTDESRQNDTLAHAVHGVLGEPGKTSQLNPRFVAEMMGFPPDWLELPFLSTEKNPSEPTETR